MKYILKRRNFWLLISCDVALIVIAWLGANLLRFEGHIPSVYYPGFLWVMKVILPLKLPFLFLFDLYRGMWRYTSLADFLNLLKATTLSSACLILLVIFAFRFEGFSRSIFLIDYVLSTVFLMGIRVSIRLFFKDGTPFFLRKTQYPPRAMRKLLLIGAGNSGEQVLRELKSNARIRKEVIGILDDNPTKYGKSIHGVRVLGGIDHLADARLHFDEIIIAAPSATSEQMRRIIALCEATGKPYKTMPGLGEIIGGRVTLQMFRSVTIDDVIGRDEVRLNEEDIEAYLRGKRVLVTGAGGSIGSELVRQASRFSPRALGLLDCSEFNLFQVDMWCRSHLKEMESNAYLADIRTIGDVNRAFQAFKPEVVFHAAAYKHVPLQEDHPWQAVFTNIEGTRNVVDAAVEAGVERFVFVSSDKAVRPVNVMGATKRANELMVASMNGRGSGRFLSVRFGNVIGSSGSVIPIFEGQIERGGPVTVTHPDMTRYFMSIPEAAQLILQAGSLGEGGEIFILDMGKPIKIVDLARDVIRLKGYEPDKDIAIVFTGLRPGEKLYEELITEGEGIVKTRHEKILVLRGNGIDAQRLYAQIEALLAIAGTFDAEAIKRKLQEIVPEYTPQEF